MEKERRVKVLSVIALIVAVLGLTIAFASLSETLKINGTAEMKSANWDIHLDNARTSDDEYGELILGGAKINKIPKVSDDKTTLTNFDVTLTKPGDAIGVLVDIVNDGDIDATLSDILYNDISIFDILKDAELCAGRPGEVDYEACLKRAKEKNIKNAKTLFEEADWDGDGITTDEEYLKAQQYILYDIQLDNDFNLFSTIHPDDRIASMFIFMFSEDCNELPLGNIVLNPNIKLVFTQS